MSFVLSGICMISSVAFAGEHLYITNVQARVVAVTLFPDQAQVIRRIVAELPAGEVTIVFANLPAATDPASIQVRGSGAALIREAALRTISTGTNFADKRAELLRRKDELEGNIDAEKKQENGSLAERAFLDGLRERYLRESSSNVALEAARWGEVLEFYRKRLTVLDSEQLQIRRVLKGLTEELNRVHLQLVEAGGQQGTNQLLGLVTLEVSKPGKVTVDFTSLVAGCAWSPRYEARVEAGTPSLGLSCLADIRQMTGEDWASVTLCLSTAQPSRALVPPEFETWYLREREPPVVYSELKKSSSPKSAAMRSLSAKDADNAMGTLSEDASPAAKSELSEPPMEELSAESLTGLTATTFSLPGLVSVPSDHTTHRLRLFEQSIPLCFSYKIIPRLLPHAFLTVSGTNTNTAIGSLLPGPAAIFLDGSFAGTSSLPVTPVGSPLTLSLGIDHTIQVRAEDLGRRKELQGLTEGRVAWQWRYRYELINTGRLQAEIILLDQIPLSLHKDIKIRVLEPDVRRQTNCVLQPNGTVEWKIVLGPGEKLVVPFVFNAEYPKDLIIEGLK